MRIADIIADHVEPGAAVLDRTPEEASLSPYAALPPNLRLTYARGPEELPADLGLTIVLHALPEVDLAVVAPGRVVHVLFAERAESYLEIGLLETLAQAGLELVGTHAVPHKTYHYAVVARAADASLGRVSLRLQNEYRFQRLFLRDREDALHALKEEVGRTDEKIRKVQEEEARLRGDAERRAADLATELMELRAAYQRLSRAHDQARVTSDQERARADALNVRFDRSQKRLVSARQSISFRIGRATRIAAKDLKRDPLGAPRRWLQVFRGPDEVLADVQRETMTQARARRDLEDVERLAVERSHFLLGLSYRF